MPDYFKDLSTILKVPIVICTIIGGIITFMFIKEYISNEAPKSEYNKYEIKNNATNLNTNINKKTEYVDYFGTQIKINKIRTEGNYKYIDVIIDSSNIKAKPYKDFYGEVSWFLFIKPLTSDYKKQLINKNISMYDKKYFSYIQLEKNDLTNTYGNVSVDKLFENGYTRIGINSEKTYTIKVYSEIKVILLSANYNIYNRNNKCENVNTQTFLVL